VFVSRDPDRPGRSAKERRLDITPAVNGTLGDRHPAMLRVREGGAAIALEVVRLADGDEPLGVPGEPILCQGQREITKFGGWRAARTST